MSLLNLNQYLLVCHEKDAGLLLTADLQLEPVLQVRDLCLFKIDIGISELKKALNPIPHFSLNRYLDKFYIWTPAEDLEHRQKVLDKFFQIIAEQYELLIDVGRNLENINNLLGFLSDMLDPINGSIIVDYGCGTGLSVGLASNLNIKLIGVDRCPKMRQISASKGMTVWSIGELARQLPNSLDGAFASYVFHLLPHTKGLELLWSRLRPGGIIAANFHKNQGVELVETCIRNLRGSIINLPNPAESERHGSYVAYKKQ
jgi:SAM-dependent methyltransferase